LVLIYTSSDIRGCPVENWLAEAFNMIVIRPFAEFPWPPIELSQISQDQRFRLHECTGILDRIGLQDRQPIADQRP
jgi:hypothetical protein